MTRSDTPMGGTTPQPDADLRMEDLFDLEELQRLQDAFAKATGIGALITHPDGTPFTKPSNFCRLCAEIIRETDKGLANCRHSDAVIGHSDGSGPIVRQCLSGGLYDGGASIVVGGVHIGNWLMGQVRVDPDDDETLMDYAREIGADEDAFADALREVTSMSRERFEAIADALFEMTGQLSRTAYLNHEQARLILEREQATLALEASEKRYRESYEMSPAGYQSLDADGHLVFVNGAWLETLGYSDAEVVGKWFGDFLAPEYRSAFKKRFELFKSLGRIHSEFVMVCKDGSQKSIAFDGVIGRDEHGDFKQTHCVLQDITERRKAENAAVESQDRLAQLVMGITHTMGKVVEARDPYTQGHQERVARIARVIADEMGRPAEEVSAIEMAALVHDIGKLGVPAEILTKPGRLSDAEMILVRQHPQLGYDILKDGGFPWPVAEIALAHHERIDGSGYPQGLTGDQIPLPSRIVAVADVVEAMSSHRPYRPTLGVEAAMEEITTNTHRYGDDVVTACRNAYVAGRIEL